MTKRVHPQQRIADDVANILRPGQISSKMLADAKLLTPERYPRAHVGQIRKKFKCLAFLESFRGLGSPLQWFLSIPTAEFCFSIFFFESKQKRTIRSF